MTTDHRAEAEEHMAIAYELAARVPSEERRADSEMAWASVHLLAFIADTLAERLPKPLISRDMTEMQDRINETIKNLSAVQRAGLRLPLAKGGPVGPSWPAEDTCDCGRAIPCRHCDEPETVTVTLPRDVV